jgi:Type IV pilin-like G and H, putative
MGIPPESKQKSSIIEIFIKLILTGILLSPVLFILQQFFVFVTYTPERYRKKNFEVIQNFTLVNRTQGNSILENGVFAKTFNELAIGTLQGENVDSSKIFQYKLDILSKDLAIIGAKSLDGEKNGFNGAVLRYKNRKGFFAVRSIICESAVMGADGTNTKNSPIVSTSGKLICAAGWKVLREDNEEPSDRELAGLIQNKAKDEIGRILREQKSTYYKQGKFVDRYSDILQEKNSSSPKFNVKIISHTDRTIVAIQNESSEQDKYKTSFGLIKIVRSKQAQPLSDSSKEKNKILWHYLDTISFLCTSNQIGTPLPKNRDLDRVIDRCPTRYTKSSVIEHEYDLAKDNLVTIRMTQEAYYQRHHRFMTDFAEFEKFTIETSRRYSSLIKVKQDPYQYNFQVNGKVLLITAQPKYFTNPLSNVTYLRISSATGADKNWPFVHTFCESKIKNILIPMNIHDTGSCPAGYYRLERGFF